jgi:sugar lactone lactonase YvrE
MIAVLLVVAATPYVAQHGPPQLALQPDPDFFKMPPGLNFGEPVAVDVDRRGHVFVADRGGISGPAYGAASSRVLEFDSEGEFVQEMGKDLYSASYIHGLRVDPEGNIWIADKGSDTVVKLTPSGHVAGVFGRRSEASEPSGQGPPSVTRASALKSPPEHRNGRFRQPTDMAWDSRGNLYVADGYINSRVAVYDKDGVWVKSVGEQGTGPGQFVNVHNIVIDDQDRIYVADRANSRIQVFDRNFAFLYEWTHLAQIPWPAAPSWWGEMIPAGATTGASPGGPGAPWALCIPPGSQNLYVGDGFPGRMYKLTLDGKVLGMYGSQGRQPGQFSWIHGLACPSDNEFYMADELNWRVQRVVARQ